MLNDEFIINIRKLLNLGEYEAKAYSILLTSGPLTAIEICKKGEIPQPKIYETLRNLQTKTLIETLNIKPQIWRVSDPINNLKSIIKEKIKELKDIE
ncbi:MAG: helix-turn-helix domain-containing protein, partial [Candidatus Aenigmatarchaeota archaeon]